MLLIKTVILLKAKKGKKIIKAQTKTFLLRDAYFSETFRIPYYMAKYNCSV